MLERVKDILVDPEDHYQTRRVLLESVALMLEKFDEYKTIIPKGKSMYISSMRASKLQVNLGHAWLLNE